MLSKLIKNIGNELFDKLPEGVHFALFTIDASAESSSGIPASFVSDMDDDTLETVLTDFIDKHTDL